MGIINEALQKQIEISTKATPIVEGDYQKDGLWYCGKCHTPKQAIPEGFTFAVPIRCKCLIDAEKEKDRLEAEYKRKQYIEKIKANSLVSSRYANCDFSHYEVTPENQKNFNFARAYVDKLEANKKFKGALFHGNTGTGKTYLAYCIGNELLNRGVPVMFTSFVKVLNKVTNFEQQAENERFIKRMGTVRVLVVDDLGAERGSDFALEQIYNIIDERYRNEKPTIITSNISVDTMMNETDIRYKRIYERILSMYYLVEFKGSSWRMGEASKNYDELQKMLEG